MNPAARTKVGGRSVSEDQVARVVLAVVRSERPTCRAVARAAGVSVGVAWLALLVAKARGLVAFEPKDGTLRPLVKEVA